MSPQAGSDRGPFFILDIKSFPNYCSVAVSVWKDFRLCLSQVQPTVYEHNDLGLILYKHTFSCIPCQIVCGRRFSFIVVERHPSSTCCLQCSHDFISLECHYRLKWSQKFGSTFFEGSIFVLLFNRPHFGSCRMMNRWDIGGIIIFREALLMLEWWCKSMKKKKK